MTFGEIEGENWPSGLLNRSLHLDFDPHILGNYLNSQRFNFFICVVNIITSVLFSALRIKWNNVKNIFIHSTRINSVSFSHFIIFWNVSVIVNVLCICPLYLPGNKYSYASWLNCYCRLWAKIKLPFTSPPPVANCMVYNKWNQLLKKQLSKKMCSLLS